MPRTLTGLFVTTALVVLAEPLLAQMPPADPARMEARIKALSRFGANEDGGIDRVAYSDADIAARAWAMKVMANELHLENVHIDAGGNIIGRRPGTDPTTKPIMTGSHIDSVLGGGNYDGQAGVVAAFEAAELLNAGGVALKSPLDIIIFSNEEGGLVGSLALTKGLTQEALGIKSDSGLTIAEGLKRIGGNPDNLEAGILPPGALKAFVELHIEQGAVLDDADIDIGVVEGIVGIGWWNVTIEGFANHAGTTPMDKRRDSLLGAAKLIQAVNEIAAGEPGRHVATVGRIRAFPGAPNVIPGRTEMSLEIRDLDTAKVEMLFGRIEAAARKIAEDSALEITFEPIDVASHAALTDERVRGLIAAAAEDAGLSYRLMPSGAGHDTQDMARIAPSGMIFVPSAGGISHSPKEFTSARDLANGADVLARTIIAIDATNLD